MPSPQAATHIPNARLFRLAVAEHLVFTGPEFSHLKQCPLCFEQWKHYIHDYVRDEKVQNDRMKRGE
jgi:hypothetical protein